MVLGKCKHKEERSLAKSKGLQNNSGCFIQIVNFCSADLILIHSEGLMLEHFSLTSQNQH